MHGLKVRATARILDVGQGLHLAELDAEDGMHVDFRPQPTKAECLRQLEWAGDRLGLAVSLEEDLTIAAGRPGMRDAYPRQDVSVVRAEARARVLQDQADNRAEVAAENDRRRACNERSTNSWLKRLKRRAGAVAS